MVFDEEQVGPSLKRGRPRGAAPYLAAWPGPSSRRRDLAPGGWCLSARALDTSSQAAAAARSAAKGVPSASTRCRTTASWTMWQNAPRPGRAWRARVDAEHHADVVVGDLDALD